MGFVVLIVSRCACSWKPLNYNLNTRKDQTYIINSYNEWEEIGAKIRIVLQDSL